MNDRKELAALLGKHYGTSAGGDDHLWAMADIIMERAARSGWAKQRTVTTSDELHQLGVGSIVKDAYGAACQRTPCWGGNHWVRIGHSAPHRPYLPAEVVWEPHE